MDVHLDLVGGIAGDMFIAALLDAFPQHEPRVSRAIEIMSGSMPVQCSLTDHGDAMLRGRRFEVAPAPWQPVSGIRGALATGHRDAGHEHTTWRSIRTRLGEAPLPPGVRTHALSIFQLLADAEAFVHGVGADQVTFHEVGAWDSIAVGAAALIDALGPARWSASAAPLGSGRIRTAHGILAVPAPATTRLLIGMPTLDDGVAGERVTPTGAALLRHLCPPGSGSRTYGAGVRTLAAAGTGFGSRPLAGVSNHLRVLCFEQDSPGPLRRALEVLEFEVDDQSGEDLAAGLDRLRAHDAVLDVTQTAVYGKKNRMMVHVRVLVRHSRLADAIEACYRETTTIGLRHHAVQGFGLERRCEEAVVDGHRLRVKIVQRPGGATAKAESDDVSNLDTHARRAGLRGRAERSVLRRDRKVDADA